MSSSKNSSECKVRFQDESINWLAEIESRVRSAHPSGGTGWYDRHYRWGMNRVLDKLKEEIRI
jgi:hypothetical protein